MSTAADMLDTRWQQLVQTLATAFSSQESTHAVTGSLCDVPVAALLEFLALHPDFLEPDLARQSSPHQVQNVQNSLRRNGFLEPDTNIKFAYITESGASRIMSGMVLLQAAVGIFQDDKALAGVIFGDAYVSISLQV